jgi:hypothetical protein
MYTGNQWIITRDAPAHVVLYLVLPGASAVSALQHYFCLFLEGALWLRVEGYSCEVINGHAGPRITY